MGQHDSGHLKTGCKQEMAYLGLDGELYAWVLSKCAKLYSSYLLCDLLLANKLHNPSLKVSLHWVCFVTVILMAS